MDDGCIRDHEINRRKMIEDFFAKERQVGRGREEEEQVFTDFIGMWNEARTRGKEFFEFCWQDQRNKNGIERSF